MGDWLNLPISNSEIDAFLKTKVGLNKQYEELAIHDCESDFNLCEYENLYDLNVLAVKLEQMSEAEKTLAAAYCSANGLKDISSVLNVCEQINDLSYVELDADSWGSKEEKLGYALIDNDNSDLKATLEQCKLGDGVSAYTYFDFEAYGCDVALNYGYFASDELFIVSNSDIDPKLYTIQELKETLNNPRLEAT